MNCIEAQALISAAHDKEPVLDTDLAAARAHCKKCEECSAFTAGLRYLDLLPVPPAPDGMTARIMEAVAPLAAEREEMRVIEAERAEADSAGTELPVPAVIEAPAEPEVVEAPAPRSTAGFTVPAWFTGPTRWATIGAVTALAATGLIAFVVIGLGGVGSTPEVASTATETAPGIDLTFGGASKDTATNAAPTPTSPAPAPTKAPDYVLYKEYVYAPGALLADASAATPTIGALSTAFASPGAASSVPVYRSPLTDGSIVVRGPDGLRVYTPVIRMMSSVKFQLTSGKPIDRFGVWPVLPDRFPVPTSSAGTPSFVSAGVDALGVTVFSATGRPVSEGFAIAPGTTGTDPAGGNPNWTWWAPAPTNP